MSSPTLCLTQLNQITNIMHENWNYWNLKIHSKVFQTYFFTPHQYFPRNKAMGPTSPTPTGLLNRSNNYVNPCWTGTCSQYIPFNFCLPKLRLRLVNFIFNRASITRKQRVQVWCNGRIRWIQTSTGWPQEPSTKRCLVSGT